MGIDMPSWDCHVDLSRVWDLHSFGEFSHAFPEVYRPLTYNIVRDDDSQDGYANQASEDYEVGITVSR